MKRRNFLKGLLGAAIAAPVALITSPQKQSAALLGGDRSGGPESLDRSGEEVTRDALRMLKKHMVAVKDTANCELPSSLSPSTVTIKRKIYL